MKISFTRALAATAAVAVCGVAFSGASYGYDVTSVSNGASVSGKISFTGKKALAPKVFKVEKTPEVCGKEDRVLEEMRIDASGGLADVVVVIKGVKKGKGYATEVAIEGPPPGKNTSTGSGGKVFPGTTIKPKGCIFGAFTSVVAQGTSMHFKNMDPVKHSPHGYAVKGRVRKGMYNLDLEGDGTLEIPVKFKKKKLKVMKLECDQHNHMQNWFYKVENPYYAISAADGTFSIGDVPAGDYQLIAWHPKFKKEQKQKIKVSAGGKISADFSFKK